MANPALAPRDTSDMSLFKSLDIPECLHALMDFAGVKFTPKGGGGVFAIAGWPAAKIGDPTNWILTMPCKIDGKRIEIPINDPIDQTDPEGHWRAIMAAAADFQYLVNSGQYELA